MRGARHPITHSRVTTSTFPSNSRHVHPIRRTPRFAARPQNVPFLLKTGRMADSPAKAPRWRRICSMEQRGMEIASELLINSPTEIAFS
jgi:hypothetical protein